MQGAEVSLPALREMHPERGLLKSVRELQVRRRVVDGVAFEDDECLDLPGVQVLHQLRQAGLRIAVSHRIEIGDWSAELCVDPVDERLFLRRNVGPARTSARP